MAPLFLSYARADDEPFARQLYTDLTTRGHTVWFDRECMPNRGLVFTREIALAIEDAARLLLVVGPAALNSDYVRAEWEHATQCCLPIHPLLRLSDYADLPQELAGRDARNFRNPATYTAELDHLCRQIAEEPVHIGALYG